MNYNKFTSPTDGDRDWNYPVAKNNFMVRELFTGPDGYGWIGNTQTNNSKPYMPSQPCGCNDHKAPSTPLNNPTPELPEYYMNNARNYQQQK